MREETVLKFTCWSSDICNQKCLLCILLASANSTGFAKKEGSQHSSTWFVTIIHLWLPLKHLNNSKPGLVGTIGTELWTNNVKPSVKHTNKPWRTRLRIGGQKKSFVYPYISLLNDSLLKLQGKSKKEKHHSWEWQPFPHFKQGRFSLMYTGLQCRSKVHSFPSRNIYRCGWGKIRILQQTFALRKKGCSTWTDSKVT